MKISPLLIYSSLLSFIGLLFISSSSLFEAEKTLGDPYFFLKKQLVWLGIGFICMFITSKIKLDFFINNSFRFYSIAIILLILVLIPGIGMKILGARRQIDLGFFNFQPSELFKLASVIFFSFLFSLPEKRNLKNLAIYLGLPLLLIILEPNLSTTIMIASIVISIYYLSGAEILSLFSAGFIITLFSLLLIFISPYRLNRVKTLLNQQSNQNLTYHSEQMILTLASGGLSGKGFANSDHKYKFLPKISTDSILAIVGEETGFIGLTLITYLFLLLISRLIRISQLVSTLYERLLLGGIACWIAYQGLINFAAIVALIPLTGIPFPFIAYGGSSIITLFCALGLAINIEKKYSKLLYSNNERDQKDSHHRHTRHSRS
ncbi:MAG TPA: FtsW/RodA/SpoVE family cell cycle protein [Candidatus Methanoperedens sp.]|nr:FtsW/RodA/SpoVE family cell cycle protein [Candidatus Methanoperedens sp.]